MAKNTFLDFSTTAGDNTDVGGVGILGSNAVSNFDNAFRTLMAILRGDLDNGVVFATKTTGYTAVANDNNGFIRFSAAATLSLTAAATLGAGWHCLVMADGGAVVIDPNASETVNGSATITVPDGYSTLLICDGTNFRATEDFSTIRSLVASSIASVSGSAFPGRLSLSSGVAVTTADVTAATTLYWVPYGGELVWLYSGTEWASFSQAQLSIALSGATASRPSDVFMDYNSGTPQLVLTAWTNDTTRATGLTTQNGVLVKSGATTQRFLGTIYVNASNQCEDSAAKRWVWNMYNRRARSMRVGETTDTWSYSTATWRQTNGSTTNQLDFVRGLDEDGVTATVNAVAGNSTTTIRYVRSAVGLDSTSSPTGVIGINTVGINTSLVAPMTASYFGLPGLGRHYLAWLERGAGGDTQTWYGDNGDATTFQSGIVGGVVA